MKLGPYGRWDPEDASEADAADALNALSGVSDDARLCPDCNERPALWMWCWRCWYKNGHDAEWRGTKEVD